MKNYLFLLVAFFFLSLNGFSQNYKTGIGLRLGTDQGVSLKKFVSSSDALELIFALRTKGIGITGLYEKHATAFDIPELQWFYGAGGHIGFWDDDRRYNDPLFGDDTETRFGIDGILGIEYTIKEVPFSLAADFHPFVNLVGYNGLQWTSAITVRFTID